MKKFAQIFLVFSLIFTFSSVQAQEDKSQRVSPPKVYKKTIKNGNEISISYSVVSARERKIWGGLVPYDKVWRTGANEATIFEVSKDCKLNGEKLKAGKYSLFTIPKEDGKWTVIINSVAHQWGAYEYDKTKDVIRFEAKAKKNKTLNEKLIFEVSDKGTFEMNWEYLSLEFKIK